MRPYIQFVVDPDIVIEHVSVCEIWDFLQVITEEEVQKKRCRSPSKSKPVALIWQLLQVSEGYKEQYSFLFTIMHIQNVNNKRIKV